MLTITGGDLPRFTGGEKPHWHGSKERTGVILGRRQPPAKVPCRHRQHRFPQATTSEEFSNSKSQVASALLITKYVRRSLANLEEQKCIRDVGIIHATSKNSAGTSSSALAALSSRISALSTRNLKKDVFTYKHPTQTIETIPTTTPPTMSPPYFVHRCFRTWYGKKNLSNRSWKLRCRFERKIWDKHTGENGVRGLTLFFRENEASAVLTSNSKEEDSKFSLLDVYLSPGVIVSQKSSTEKEGGEEGYKFLGAPLLGVRGVFSTLRIKKPQSTAAHGSKSWFRRNV